MKEKLFCLVAAAAILSSVNPTQAAQPKNMTKIEQKKFGSLADGTPINIYTLSNGRVTAKVMDYGTILTELWVPDRDGKATNVVMGFDNLDQYVKGHPFFGAVAGRVANRIGDAKFTLDGKEYK